ncbi:MAG: DUF362 domain-containing protein [Planctomycetales bacterium]
MIEFPTIFRLRQKFDTETISDIPAVVRKQLDDVGVAQRVRPGETVAITAGSRGIANIHLVIKAIAAHLQSIGAKPFIVPAMGSHGGGTAEGQREIVENYGITEEFTGCPIQSSMETVIVCRTEEGIPVHFDKFAYEADHVVVCGRVKPHTGFIGEIESGLMKMMLIGLGKHEGAKIYHRAIQNYSFGQIVRSVASRILENCGIVAGVAIVENGYDETAKIQAVAADEFEDREKELLVLAKKWMPKLPFDDVDVLLVDEIGKNISGSGMDTNVIGRKHHDHKALADETPKVKRIAVRGLTEITHGNACGIGMAEFATARAISQVNMEITRINALTGGHPTAAMLPLSYESDREILDAALPTIGLTEPQDARLLWIPNTLNLAEVECGAAYLKDARERSDLEILGEPRDLPFDERGDLRPLFESPVGVH